MGSSAEQVLRREDLTRLVDVLDPEGEPRIVVMGAETFYLLLPFYAVEREDGVFAPDSTLLEFPLKDEGQKFGQASADFKWAAAVASFGMLLRNSPYAGNSTYAAVIEMAESAKGSDKQGYRAEFIELVKRARQLGQ